MFVDVLVVEGGYVGGWAESTHPCRVGKAIMPARR